MSQLAFAWNAPEHYAPEDFIISDSNKDAVTFIDNWPKAHDAGALLVGPAASGKTHLAHRFAIRTGAVLLPLAQLGKVPSEELWGDAKHAVLENCDHLTDEAALFHLLRHAESTQRHLLLTARVHAKDMGFSLPDLRSRLLALPVATILPPDDTMLHAFFTKAFADRQWRVSPAIVSYLVVRTERSFAEAQILIQKLECLVMTTNRELTIPLIKPLVEK